MLDLSIASSGGDAQSGASPEQAPVPTTVRLVDLLHKPPQQKETEQAFVIIVSGQTHRLERPTSDLYSSSRFGFFYGSFLEDSQLCFSMGRGSLSEVSGT